MNSKRRILLFGIGYSSKPEQFEDNELIFVETTFPDHMANYDFIVYFDGAFPIGYNRGALGQRIIAPIPPNAVRRIKEISAALEKGKTICFIGNDSQDYVTSEILDLNNIGVFWIEKNKELKFNLTTKKSEFKPFLDDVGATSIKFSSTHIDEICSIKNVGVVGFSKRVGKGLLLFLPCFWGSRRHEYMVDHLEKLCSGLISYSSRRALEPPSYLENFQFANEWTARKQIDRITAEEITPLQNKVARYDRLKKILWFGDDDLVQAIDEFLKEIGFETLIDEIFLEDLWIMNGEERSVIVEVKSKSRNLARKDIAKFDYNRERREVPNLPALLIANTFMNASSFESKDQIFPPDVLQKAISSNVIVTRTIDLARIFDILDQKQQSPCQFLLEKIVETKGGWLTVQDNGITVITK